MDVIQFGTTVIDETLKRTFTLSNKGALGCTFEFFKVTGKFSQYCLVKNVFKKPAMTGNDHTTSLHAVRLLIGVEDLLSRNLFFLNKFV